MITFKDRPCGHGKTTELLKSFDLKRRYFCVVPTRSEVDRYIKEAVVPFTTPEDRTYTDDQGNKRHTLKIHLKELVEDGENIVTTHALFDQINMREFPLTDYHVCIDETFDVVQHLQGPSEAGFHKTYVQDGLATVDDEGKVTPTEKWLLEGDECYQFKLLEVARTGRLYIAKDRFYVTVVPPEMFTDNRSCLVNTYMAEGSIMAMYLRKFGIPYQIDSDPDQDRRLRERAKQRLDLQHLKFDDKATPSNKNKLTGWGYKNQGSMGTVKKKRISQRLVNLRGRGPLKGVPAHNIMLTCRQDVWFDDVDNQKRTKFASDTRLGKVNYVARNAKGTNEFRHCTHAVHLYDLNLNPAIKFFLDMSEEDEDAWRTSELVQWLFRSAIRNEVGGPVQAFFASEKMLTLVEDWLKPEEFTLVEAA